MIYLPLLKNLPFYSNNMRRHLLDKGMSMIIPSELAEVSLTSHSQLIVCDDKTGAYNVAIEIQNLCRGEVSIEVLHRVHNYLRNTRPICTMEYETNGKVQFYLYFECNEK